MDVDSYYQSAKGGKRQRQQPVDLPILACKGLWVSAIIWDDSGAGSGCFDAFNANTRVNVS